MVGVYAHRLAGYEFCPARYRLEYRSKKNPCTKFEVIQLLFAQFFRTMQYERMNVVKMESLVDQYRSILHPKGESISSSVSVAYYIKCFEKLYYDIKKEGEYFIPDVFIEEFEGYAVKVCTDLIFTDKVKPEENSMHTYRPRINFVYLVSNEYWDEVSLSNRLEVYLSRSFIFPKLKKDGNTQWKVIFLNAENGKSFEIRSDSSTQFAGDKSRLRKIIKGIEARDFMRTPVGALCAVCPCYNSCSPKNFSNSNEFIDTLKQPL